jgi:hypothetical protein
MLHWKFYDRRRENEMKGCDPRDQRRQQEAQSRRDFLKRTGERALWTAPVVTVMVLASGTPAQAHGGYKKEKHSKAYNKHKKAKIHIWKWLQKWSH